MLDVPPKPLDEDVVEHPSSSIDADDHTFPGARKHAARAMATGGRSVNQRSAWGPPCRQR